jgi:ABC-type transport system involved in Fe-S cluster assembly fused permease/ATPase subunit
VIAHRLATIVNADKIVMDKGFNCRGRNAPRINKSQRWVLQNLYDSQFSVAN